MVIQEEISSVLLSYSITWLYCGCGLVDYLGVWDYSDESSV